MRKGTPISVGVWRKLRSTKVPTLRAFPSLEFRRLYTAQTHGVTFFHVRPVAKSPCVHVNSWGRIPQGRPGAGFCIYDKGARTFGNRSE